MMVPGTRAQDMHPAIYSKRFNKHKLPIKIYIMYVHTPTEGVQMRHGKRGRQVMPTRQQQQELKRMLLDRAETGDIHAAGWILLLGRVDHIERLAKLNGGTRHGIQEEQ